MEVHKSSMERGSAREKENASYHCCPRTGTLSFITVRNYPPAEELGDNYSTFLPHLHDNFGVQVDHGEARVRVHVPDHTDNKSGGQQEYTSCSLRAQTTAVSRVKRSTGPTKTSRPGAIKQPQDWLSTAPYGGGRGGWEVNAKLVQVVAILSVSFFVGRGRCWPTFRSRPFERGGPT